MIKNIFLVWTHPASTQDKGWVGGSLASLIPHAFPMVIEPDLNCIVSNDPTDWQIILDKRPELCTYRMLGLATDSDSLILAGNVWNDFSATHALVISTLSQFGDAKRILRRMKPLDSRDVSRFLARQIERCLRKKRVSTGVIELNARPNDPQSTIVLSALHVLAAETSACFKTIIVADSRDTESEISEMIQTARKSGAHAWVLHPDSNPLQSNQNRQRSENTAFSCRNLVVPTAPTVFKWREQFIAALQKNERKWITEPQSKLQEQVTTGSFGFGFVARPLDL